MLIYKKIPAIIGDVGAIEKSRVNKIQNYSFRGIDDVYAAIQPLLHKHEVFYVPEIIKEFREERPAKNGGTLIYTILSVKFTFYASDGSFVTASTIGEAMDSGDKSSNKAMSAALKYALLQVFCIPTEEDKDTENSSPKPKAKGAFDSIGSATIPFKKSESFGRRLDSLSDDELQRLSDWYACLKDPPTGAVLQFKKDLDAYIDFKFGRAR